ncbi:MAG: DNA-directed RNA polymerase III subunit rpc25 [Bathelium mastoideum]|nr:MAG: DNA-directed RNA polymerase III subunit rpc25 [Bathelium mastoideum]KAI9694432.1 MAG: DNA-directed RNA polymerase III subunit rpc25 [Bathelium mastoideum]
MSTKVVQGVGLCISMWSLNKASDGLIGNGDGLINVNVEFDMAVFRPFKGEVIQGQIRRNVKGVGIQITMDFFEDIWVQCPVGIPKPAYFDETEQVWAWQVEGGDPAFYDNNEQVRFRVEREIWNDLTPDKPQVLASAARPQQVEARSPYIIIASMAEDGLGPNLWWDVQGSSKKEDGMEGQDSEGR